ncbi:MAG: hypothetical protein JNM60_02320 [Candidatus Competibacteraceae bacterium]|nr:hypothetical protein [Candidatus Competibacteraceae bacterium]
MLIECPECKKSVSDKAPACPNCGAEIAALGPFAKKGKPIAPAQPARKWARAFAVLFWVGVIRRTPGREDDPASLRRRVGPCGGPVRQRRRPPTQSAPTGGC